MEKKNVYIMSGCRTAIGKYGGSLKNVPAHELGTVVVKEALKRANVSGEMVDEVMLGEVRQSTEASNIARLVALEAGLPETVPGFTVNRLCASAMQAIYSGCQQIWLDEANVIVAGGTECESRAPIYLRGTRWGGNKNTLVDSNVEAGYFKDEIVPVTVKEKKKEFVFDTDESPRPTTTLEVLAKLKPLNKRNDGSEGTVTAGTSCGINDGAAAVVLMSEDKVKETGLKPMARIIDITVAALDPTIMGYGPYYATKKILERNNMTIDDIDLVELNEAFASQSVACIRDLGMDPAKVNINGGAIALGHPLGCTGARLIVTLMHSLKRTGKKIGLATLCIGGGQAMATLIEMCD